MKICWDNIENIRLTKDGNFRDIHKGTLYYYKDACLKCGESFLGSKNNEYCSVSCASGSRKHTEEAKRKMSDSKIGENNPMYGKQNTEEFKRMMKEKMSGENNPMYGRHHSKESKQKMSKNHADVKDQKHPMYGRHHSEESKQKMSDSKKGKYVGENSYSWRGGYNSKDIPIYDTYASQLKWCESVRRNESDPNILEVKCTHCDKWYVPKLSNVRRRLQILKGNIEYRGEHRFYCSDECKHSCPIYQKSPETLMKQDAIRAGRLPWIELEREMQPELREMVLERDGYQCVKCGSTEKLCCHHILPVAIEPLESADIDNCMTLCYNCHKEVHSQPGCRYNELRMEVCID